MRDGTPAGDLRNVFLLGCCLSLAAVGASATVIQPDTQADDLTDNGNCTLREAVVAANSNTPVDQCPAGQATQVDTIELTAGTYSITLGPRGDDNALTGDLDVTDELEIVGGGADTTVIDGTGLDRIFQIAGGVSLSLTDLSVTGGDPGDGNGGAIENFGDLTLLRVELFSNQTNGAGGAIRNNSVASLFDSSLIGNVTNDHGGGLDNHGTANLVNCTVSGNDGGNLGGGLYNNDGEQMTVDAVTVVGNVADAGAAVRNGGTLTMTGSVLVGVCAGQVSVSGGGNLESPGDGCGLGGADQASVADAGLGELGLHGGTTRSHSLVPGSPAIDGGASTCPDEDQRGTTRPLDGDGDLQAECDAGAFEHDPAASVFHDDFESGDLTRWSSST